MKPGVSHRNVAIGIAILGVVACDNLEAPKPGRTAAEASDSPQPPRPPVPGKAFVYSAAGDVSGYYLPVSDVAVGPYRLDHIFLGQAFEFEAWERGEPDQTFAPLMLQFDDVSSPMVMTELGEQRSLSVRVLPQAYAVTDDVIRFAGTSEELGAVSFALRLDRGALAVARRTPGDDTAVLTGTLTAGGRTFGDVPFRWYGGD